MQWLYFCSLIYTNISPGEDNQNIPKWSAEQQQNYQNVPETTVSNIES